MLAAAAAARAAPLPPTHPAVKDVVFTLVRGSDDLRVFEERSTCLQRALAGGGPFDSVAFHEGDLAPDARQRLTAQNPRLRFVNVDDAFVVPSNVTLPDAVLNGQVEGIAIGWHRYS